MKKLYLSVFAATASLCAMAQPNPFISEIHYDNTGGDVNERIEIQGTVGLNLSGYTLVLYNGAIPTAAVPYSTTNLAGTITASPGCTGTGVVVITFPVNGIQNGIFDGLALVDNTGTVLEFLSYEGVIIASGGAADGMTSTDIGALEDGNGSVDGSIQRIGPATFITSPTANTFGSCNSAVVAVTFDAIRAISTDRGTRVMWNNRTETNIQSYVVEHSTDGVTFTNAGTVAPVRNNGGAADYSFLHVSPIKGRNYYRVTALEQSGNMKYSNTVSIEVSAIPGGLAIYPNPATAGVFTFTAPTALKGNYTATLVNSNGQQVYRRSYFGAGLYKAEQLNFPATISGGIYRLVLTDGKQQFAQTVVIR